MRKKTTLRWHLVLVLAMGSCLGVTSFKDRITATIKFLAGTPSKWSNERRWRDDALSVVKQATETSLAKPVLVSSLYYPGEPKNGKVMALITWLELVPTLSAVTIRNPVTDKEFKVNIPRDYLNQLRSGNDMRGVMFCYVEHVPIEIAGTDPAQNLKVYITDLKNAATLYPSLRPASAGENVASTQPTTSPESRLQEAEKKQDLNNQSREVEASSTCPSTTPVVKRAFENKIGMRLAKIEPGRFQQGSPADEEGRNKDETQHEVKLSNAFYLGTTEVTQTQWKAVMGADKGSSKGDNMPVDEVSWDDAMDFCRRLSTQEGKRYRLPTEAEWEYACRAGARSPFHVGATISTDQANYNGNVVYGNGVKGEYRQQTMPVASFGPNAWGLYDMHGNVWEWCSDWYGEYPVGQATDPMGGAEGTWRVLRGGCWASDPQDCRSAHRFWNAPANQVKGVGFRVALDFPEGE